VGYWAETWDNYVGASCYITPSGQGTTLPSPVTCDSDYWSEQPLELSLAIWMRDTSRFEPMWLEEDWPTPLEEFAQYPGAANAQWIAVPPAGEPRQLPGIPDEWVQGYRGTLPVPPGEYQVFLRLTSDSDPGLSGVHSGEVLTIPGGPEPVEAGAIGGAGSDGPPAAPEGSRPAGSWVLEHGGAPAADIEVRLGPDVPAPGVPVTVDLRLLPQGPEAAPAGAVTAAVWFLGIGDHPAARQEIVPRAGIEERGAWTPLRAVAGPGGGQRFVGAVPVPPGRHQLVVLMSDPGGVYDGILAGPVVEMPGG
jgi:hypothetical protein